MCVDVDCLVATVLVDVAVVVVLPVVVLAIVVTSRYCSSAWGRARRRRSSEEHGRVVTMQSPQLIVATETREL